MAQPERDSPASDWKDGDVSDLGRDIERDMSASD